MITLIYFVTLHLVADFFLQTREMAKKKSTEFKWLLRHIGIVTFVFGVGVIPIYGVKGFAFVLCNSLLHLIVDGNTWSLYRLWVIYRNCNIFSTKEEVNIAVESYKYWEDTWFYKTLGIDQWLHTVTIIGLSFYLGVVK